MGLIAEMSDINDELESTSTEIGNRPVSMHERIRRNIESKIFSGEWKPGQRIPAEDALASSYQCSRMTINKVLTTLAKADVLVRRPKVGTFVALHSSHNAIIEVRDVSTEVADLGLPYSFTLLGRIIRKATKADRSKLDLPPSCNVVELACCHFADQRPFCHEHRIISLHSVPAAEHEPFLAVAPTSWLVINIPWSEAEQSIAATTGKVEICEILRIAPHSACLTIERKTWLANQFVTWAEFTYPGDVYQLHARLRG